MRNRASCVKVELPHNNFTRGDPIPHEQKYNTGHGLQAITNEVCRSAGMVLWPHWLVNPDVPTVTQISTLRQS